LNYKILSSTPIKQFDFELDINILLDSVKSVNQKLIDLNLNLKGVNLFEVTDFRVLSGVVGELLAEDLASKNTNLEKNPNLNGYPDLLNLFSEDSSKYFKNCIQSDFLKYKFGGFEIKNSFGSKKSGSSLLNNDTRIGGINKKIDWKAHHRETNNLIALYSDFVDGNPTIIALFYSNNLEEDDWRKVSVPKRDSAMTSFTTLNREGYVKLKSGIKFCLDSEDYLSFFTN
jgi:hypothetical protein